MKYGAIDIGTNAARLLIGEVVHDSGRSFVKKDFLHENTAALG